MRLLCMVLWAGVLALPLHAERLLLDAGRDTVAWRPNDGGEFPGATASLALITDPEAGQVLSGEFTFAGESRYAGLHWWGDVPEGQAIGFSVLLPDHRGGMLRVRDATGQELLTGFEAPQGRWARVEIPLRPERFGAHWGGANDGRLHFPLQAILVAVSRGPERGSMRLSNLYVVQDGVPASRQLAVWVAPDVLCGIVLSDTQEPGARTGFEVTVQNRLERDLAAQLSVMVRGTDGETRRALTADVRLGPWGRRAERVSLPADRVGYWQLTAEVASGDARTPAFSGVAVVPRPRHYGEDAPGCYFGLQFIPDFEAAERLGAKAVRLAPGWRWAEPRRGEIRWADYLDPDVRQARQHGMAILMTLQAIAPDWAAWQVPDKPQRASLPDPDRLADWERFVREVAARYRGQLAAIEIQNEPDLTCAWQPGLPFEEGVEFYVKLLRAGRAGAKAGDPEVTIAGCDVSGGDFDGGLKFTRAVLEKAADQLDLYTGHPYSGVRYFGPGQEPLWPQTNRMPEKCLQALDLLAEFGRPRRMWIGELGWGLKDDAEPLGEHSTAFAACVAQALVCGKAVRGVERFLWFTFSGCNEGGYEYGLVRGRPAYPLPAALAYAMAAYHLTDTAPLETVQPVPDVWRAAFRSDRRGELVTVWWSCGDPVRLVPPPDGPAGRWSDSWGGSPEPGEHGVLCGRLPVYWTLPLAPAGETAEVLSRVEVIPSEPVALRSAHLSSTSLVVVRLLNRTARVQPVRITVRGAAHAAELPVSADTQPVALPLNPPLVPGVPYVVPVGLEAGPSRLVTQLEGTLELLPRPPADLRVDGDAAEWHARPGFLLETRQSVLPADPGIGWDGPQDLGARAWLACDADGLCFAAEVTDDVHAVPQADPDGYWGSDSVQVAIDPLGDGAAGYDVDDREVGLVLGDDGPHIHRSVPGPAAPLAAAEAAFRRGPGRTVYEARIPWAALGLPAPAPGQVMALNFIVNDNDGGGRAYWLGLTPGIGEAKTPGAYRRFAVAAP